MQKNVRGALYVKLIVIAFFDDILTMAGPRLGRSDPGVIIKKRGLGRNCGHSNFGFKVLCLALVCARFELGTALSVAGLSVAGLSVAGLSVAGLSVAKPLRRRPLRRHYLINNRY